MSAEITTRAPKLPGAHCERCPLNDARYTCVPYKPAEGKPKLIVVGESPGPQEARRGEPFVGPSGKLQDQLHANRGVTHDQVSWHNAVACHPTTRLDPGPYYQAMAACQDRLALELLALPDDVPVLALGGVAQASLGIELRDQWRQEALSRKWAVATYHPAHCLRPDGVEDFIYLLTTTRKALTPRIEFPQPGLPLVVYPPDDETVGVDDAWLALHEERKKAGLCIGWEHARSFFGGVLPQDLLCIDLETNQVDWRNDSILLLGVSKPAVPGGDPRVVGTTILEVTKEALFTEEGAAWLKWLYEHHAAQLGGHNYKFDMLFMMEQRGLANYEPGWDTILMASVWHELWIKNLKELETFYFDVYDYEKENVAYLKGKTDSFSKIPHEQLQKYLTYDVHFNLMLAYQLREELKRAGQWGTPYNYLVLPVSRELTDVEFHGVAVDMDQLHEERRLMLAEEEEIAAQVQEASRGAIKNPASTQQVAAYLYDVLRLRPPKLPGKAARSTDKAVLDALKGQHPIIELLRHQRRVSKIRGAFIDQLLKFTMQDAEGVWRVYPRYLQFQVRTGRLSARGPSIQTIPRADDREEGQYGTRIKNCIIPKPGWVMFAVDGSQWELRVVAVVSGDEYLMDIYRRGIDFHGAMCDVLFGEGKWGKEDRAQEKRIMFAFVYGGTVESSLNVYEVDRARKAAMGKRFEEQLKTLIAWRKQQAETAAARGFLESRIKRRFHFQLITQASAKEVAKQAVNYPIQGMAADLTELAGMRAGPRLRAIGAYPTIHIHDSITGECPIEALDQACRICAEELVRAGNEVFPEIPWKAEAEWGYRWGSLESYKL